jgi:hypothetical protein
MQTLWDVASPANLENDSRRFCFTILIFEKNVWKNCIKLENYDLRLGWLANNFAFDGNAKLKFSHRLLSELN